MLRATILWRIYIQLRVVGNSTVVNLNPANILLTFHDDGLFRGCYSWNELKGSVGHINYHIVVLHDNITIACL